MAGTYRHQALIEAPIDDVWAIVSDPLAHPEWWSDVIDVRIEEPLVEGGEYTRTSKLMPFLDAVADVWVAERLDELREARFRCARTGTWAHFSLTSAQTDTFVELETGMDPTSRAGFSTSWTRSRARSSRGVAPSGNEGCKQGVCEEHHDGALTGR
jgi:hypothetical protein